MLRSSLPIGSFDAALPPNTLARAATGRPAKIGIANKLCRLPARVGAGSAGSESSAPSSPGMAGGNTARRVGDIQTRSDQSDARRRNQCSNCSGPDGST